MCVQACQLFREVSIAFLTAIIATYVYEWWKDHRRQRRLRKQFGPLEGDYSEYERKSGEQMAPTEGLIRIRYCGATKFTTEAIAKNGSPEWRGEIFMREETGVLGEGFYWYLNKDDTGVHSVIYNSRGRHFNVSGSNTNEPEGKKDFKMVWQRKD